MELDKRAIQTEDIGTLAGVLVRMSNTAEAFALKIASLEGLMTQKDKTIAELTALNKRLIDEKNSHVPADTHGSDGGNGIAAG